jgi:2-methylcitrate dehydratase PrpD
VSAPAGAKAQVAARVGELCRWAAALELRAIPAPVLSHAVLVLGDNLAATISAADEPEVRAWHDRAVEARTSEQATIFRSGGPRVALAEAAVANGLAITWNELDEGYTKAAVHPGALSQPALLAAAEADGASVGVMLRAVVGAYEIGTRFARAWAGTLPRLHPHGTYNAVCAAAGVSLVRSASAEFLERALTAASTMVSPGPYSHPIEGALVRNAWPAAGAWLGVFACELARIGVGGLPGGPYDVFDCGFGAPSRPAELTEGLGADWTITAGYHKTFAACHHSHAAMEALDELREKHPEVRGGEAIEEIVVAGSDMAFNFSNAAPETTLAAKFSIPHAVAGTVAYGSASPRIFSAEGLHDPRIASLRARVRLEKLAHVKPWPYNRPAEVTVRLRGGGSLSASCEAALGSPSRPLSTEQVLAKIRALSERTAPGLAGAVIELRGAIERLRIPELSCGEWVRGFFR